MSKISLSQGKHVEIANGTYPVLCIGVKDDHLDNSQYGSGDVVRIYLQFPDLIDEESGDFVELDVIANRVWNPKSKLWSFASAFGLRCDEDVKEFETEDMVGKDALAFIENETKDGNVWPKVKNIIAAPRGKAATVTAPQAPSVINPDGTPSWTAFWAEIKRLGVTREGVAAHVGGDLEVLMAMDGPDVAGVLEEIKAKVG